jgi:hypothetical protein
MQLVDHSISIFRETMQQLAVVEGLHVSMISVEVVDLLVKLDNFKDMLQE